MAESDLRYHMNNKNRGMALIFSYKHFSPEQNFAERTETDLDCSNIEMRLKASGFLVYKQTTKPKQAKLTKEETLSSIDKVVKKYGVPGGLLENSDCIVVVFLSYGADGVIFAYDQHMLFYEDILDRFNGIKCPALIGKPKLFIVQASPIRYTEEEDGGEPAKPGEFIHRIPSEANTLIAWNPLPGVVDPKRNTKQGSLFIRSLCNKLAMSDGKVLSMPTLVRKTIREVSEALEKENPGLLVKYEYRIPYMINMLTKEFTLTPKKNV